MPGYSYPILSLPASPETIAFRALESVLRNDETLDATIRQWCTWDGGMADLADPAFSTCPMLRLSPFPESSEWVTEQQHGGTILVRVQLTVAGTSIDQAMNLWSALRSAIFPADIARRAAVLSPLQLAGIMRPIISQAAYGVLTDADTGAPLLVAEGLIKLTMLVMT